MSHSNNNSQETNSITYTNGCNGDCYQGRWCDCKDECNDLSEEDKSEIIPTFIISAVIAAICAALVYFIANGPVMYGG